MDKIGKTLYQWWMKFAHALAVVNTTVLLTVVYVLLIGPMSLAIWLFRKDLLRHRIKAEPSFWITKEPASHEIEQSLHQF